jgi:hypothetical protein
MSSKSRARSGGAFGNKSKYQKSLERQAELRKQIAEFEAKQAEDAKKAEKAKNSEPVKKAVKPKAKKAEKKQENATTATE